VSLLSNILFRNAELSCGAAGAALGRARRRRGRLRRWWPFDPTEFIDEDDEFW